ncbi:hypothetical protein ACHAQA_009270 [Verticillium albo-atrum]
MSERHIVNDFTKPLPFPHLNPPETLLLSSLQRILNSSPPQSTYTKSQLSGLLAGHTGIAYLFLHVATSLPKLQVHGYPARHWAHAYISGARGHPALEPGNCGLASEVLSHAAVRACITRDLNDVRQFLSVLPQVLAAGALDRPASPTAREQKPTETRQADPFPSGLVYGRAGALYLLRLIRHWVPQSAPLVEYWVVLLTDHIISTDDDGHGNWLWSGARHLGAAHGDMGIITQLVLTTPPLAPRLADKLAALLNLQLEDGNWPSVAPSLSSDAPARAPAEERVQWCHGAPGIVLSLLSLRPFFPALRERIDAAVEKGRAVTWERGLLRKEPSLCHGILGNALIFPPGPQRDTFLHLATPEKIAEARRADADVFASASCGKDCAVLMNYDPSAAWTWMVCQRQTPRLILYNDM